MKRKIIIGVIICFVLAIIIVGFVLWNNRTVSTITLDINPSIEINLDKNNKVKSIIAINEDAKDIISDELINKSLDETIFFLSNKLAHDKYVNDDRIKIILYTKGKVSIESVESRLKNAFNEKDIDTEIILVESISKEDEQLAKKYDVSPAKVSYIKTITQDNETISIESLVNESVDDLIETKMTGKYCDKGYTLEGDWCLKEKERFEAKEGAVCPSNYTEYNGKCYEEAMAHQSDEYTCDKGFTLTDGKCIIKDTRDALGRCDTGEYKDGYCIVKTYTGDAREYCRITPSTDLLYNGRCLGRKPPINGGCLGNDKMIGGYCYDTSPSSGYKADWVCPDGSFITNPDGSLMYPDKKCYKETKTNPTSYYCEEDGILNGKKCEYITTEEPIKEWICPNGYTPIDDGSRCINKNKSANKENGFVCEGENARVSGKTCIIYDAIPAKQ